MATPKRLTLTKLEVARRQFETAVHLWFYDGDPVSIHTLTAAAGRVVHDLAKAKGFSPTMFDTKSLPKSETALKAYKKMVCAAETYFKHAERDREKTFVFNTAQTDFYLFDSIQTYARLADHCPKILKTYLIYFGVCHPQYWNPADILPVAKEFIPVEVLRGAAHKFFEYFNAPSTF